MVGEHACFTRLLGPRPVAAAAAAAEALVRHPSLCAEPDIHMRLTGKNTDQRTEEEKKRTGVVSGLTV